METPYQHTPVLLKETLELMSLRNDSIIVDATCGEGGHSFEIAHLIPKGRLICIDRNEDILKKAKERLADFPNVSFYNTTFDRISEVLAEERLAGVDDNEHDARGLRLATDGLKADGILADLGISMFHLKNEDLGFSYTDGASLDMRLDKWSDLTAQKVVNSYRESEIADILYKYGEEYESRRIARAIVQARPVRSASQLAETVRRAKKHTGSTEKNRGKARSHPATKTFQALRIFVNKELEILESFIPRAVDNLCANGRLIIMSYHSLEDRIVKHAFRGLEADGKGEILTKKPLVPGEDEIRSNRAARSAKLRVFQRVENE